MLLALAFLSYPLEKVMMMAHSLKTAVQCTPQTNASTHDSLDVNGAAFIHAALLLYSISSLSLSCPSRRSTPLQRLQQSINNTTSCGSGLLLPNVRSRSGNNALPSGTSGQEGGSGRHLPNAQINSPSPHVHYRDGMLHSADLDGNAITKIGSTSRLSFRFHCTVIV